MVPPKPKEFDIAIRTGRSNYSVVEVLEGLSEGDAHYELKKSLMAEIFEANAQLLRHTGS